MNAIARTASRAIAISASSGIDKLEMPPGIAESLKIAASEPSHGPV